MCRLLGACLIEKKSSGFHHFLYFPEPFMHAAAIVPKRIDWQRNSSLRNSLKASTLASISHSRSPNQNSTELIPRTWVQKAQ